MRWLFADRKREPEASRVREIESKIADWWLDFALKAPEIAAIFDAGSQWDLPAWIHEHLGAIDDEIMWEFGAALRGKGHRLVLTPESRKDLRPLVQCIVDSAPKVPGWEFYAYRLPENLEVAAGTVEARAEGSIEGVEVVVDRQAGNLVSLRFVSPSFAGPEDETATNIAFVAGETLLGEEVLDHWIGEISVERKKKGLLGIGKTKGKPMPLRELNANVSSMIVEIRASLPDRPCFEWFDKEAHWSLLKMSPKQADDYAHRDDLLIHSTLNAELYRAYYETGIASERFSRHGETFCYLKIDGSEGLDGSDFADRTEIEDALNAVLVKTGKGCTIGGGTGLRYAYIDLALLDFADTAFVIRDILRNGKLPKRTWLLFLDSDYQAEWLGAYDDTPPPPGYEG